MIWKSPSKYFEPSEFAQRSWTSKKSGRHPSMPYPLQWYDSKLGHLIRLLSRIRSEWENPITIVSGFRSPVFNDFLPGAAKQSQHMHGTAADIIVHGVPAITVHARILMLLKDELEVPQTAQYESSKLYLGGLGWYPDFTHVDIRPRPGKTSPARWIGKRTMDTTLGI